MAAIVLADVQAIAADITSVPAAILAFVNTKIAVDVFDGEDGESTKLVRCYLAAHWATVLATLGGAAAGAITSESEGGISRSYAQMDMSGSALGATQYGIQALFFIRLYASGAWIADPCA